MTEQEEAILKVKKQSLCDIMAAIKVLIVIPDKDYLNATQKHNLRLINNAATTLIESLKQKEVKNE